MERRDFTYNDKTYSILLPSVRAAMQLCGRVAVLVGPVLGTLKQDTAHGGMEAFSGALRSIDPTTLDSLFMDAVKASKLVCEGESVSGNIEFEKHFGKIDNRGDVYPVCCWVLWECVRDFFPQLGVFVQAAKAAAEKAFQSQTDGQKNGGLVVQFGPECAPGPNSSMARSPSGT